MTEHHWLNDKRFVDAVAVAMITHGPVVITVGFIGYGRRPAGCLRGGRWNLPAVLPVHHPAGTVLQVRQAAAIWPSSTGSRPRPSAPSPAR